MSEQMKILIAYDGSDCANAALADLPRAGLPRVAEALMLSVAEVFLPPSSSPAPALPAEVPLAVQRARAQATHAVDEAGALAQHARTQLLRSFPAWEVQAEACADSPAWAVVKKADTWPSDLIVVGSHGRSAMARFVLGSVSQKILTEARCAVRVGRSHRQTSAAPVRLLIGVDGRPMPPPQYVRSPHVRGRSAVPCDWSQPSMPECARPWRSCSYQDRRNFSSCLRRSSHRRRGYASTRDDVEGYCGGRSK
jgi:nucleotide-binding universal stress UspA family protein